MIETSTSVNPAPLDEGNEYSCCCFITMPSYLSYCGMGAIVMDNRQLHQFGDSKTIRCTYTIMFYKKTQHNIKYTVWRIKKWTGLFICWGLQGSNCTKILQSSLLIMCTQQISQGVRLYYLLIVAQSRLHRRGSCNRNKKKPRMNYDKNWPQNLVHVYLKTLTYPCSAALNTRQNQIFDPWKETLTSEYIRI